MVQKGRVARTVVALCVSVATLSACGSTGDAGSDAGADGQEQEVVQEQPRKQEARPERKKQQGSRPAATDADLDAYVASAEKTMRQMFGGAAFEKLYSEIDIVPVYPSGIEYDYTFRRAVDPTLAEPELDRQTSTLRAQSRAVVIPEMEKVGFADPTVTFTYRNPGGAVVWTRTFS